MKKTILGLDLGINSISWALIDKATKLENEKIKELNEGITLGLGSEKITQETVFSKLDLKQAPTKGLGDRQIITNF